MTDIKQSPPRPRDPDSSEELPPRAQPGYYPGFSTMAQQPDWDEATAKVIGKRLAAAGINFFTPEEARIMQAALDCVMPQSDRDEAHQIPVLALIDDRLHNRRFDGYIYEGTVEDDIAHRLGLAAIESVSRTAYKKTFAQLCLHDRETILMSVRDGHPGPGWNCAPPLSPRHYWNLLIRDAISAYYAHPYAWDEIGFGGPAYPRGYMRLTKGLPEPWEKEERRYNWLAPAESRSDSCQDNQSLFSEAMRSGKTGNH